MATGARRTRAALVGVALVLAGGTARAGAELPMGRDASLDLGFTLHGHALLAREADAEGREFLPRMLVRRARLRLDARVGDHLGARLQTDRGDGDGRLGVEYRLIDAFLTAKVDRHLQLRAGLHLPPSLRQNVTASSALLVFDRPSLAFKALTWGTRAPAQLGNGAIPDLDPGLRAPSPVRDMGLTIHGDIDLGARAHLKYFVGAYEGIRAAGITTFRTTARLQLNVGDAEAGYIVSGSYLGAKRTVAVGASVDTQPKIARDDARGLVGYRLLSADVFVEQRVIGRPVTFEAGVASLHLGGATQLDADGRSDTPTTNARRAEGAGAYGQAAILLGDLQPWLGYERWEARDAKGSFQAVRFGVTRYLAGMNANVKLAYEHLRAHANVGRSGGTAVGTLIVGLFLSY